MTQLPSHTHLPRWRGFNLLEKFTASTNTPYREEDFAIMAEWGFDFVRLPLSYRCWTRGDDYGAMDEGVLREIEQAVGWGREYGIHVNLNFHRLPGYCVNAPAERLNLWQDEEALEASAWQWAHFAARYRGIPAAQLSFNLLNEPPFDLPEAEYVRVATRLIEAIRAEDQDRLILADGLAHGTVPVPGLAAMGVAQSTRGYAPMPISHWGATWVEPQRLAARELAWPLTMDNGAVWDKTRLRRDYIQPWQQLGDSGVGVHVGEWGAYNRTPHDITLRWMRDYLDLWREAGWGWALWNLRGSFGVLDSGRADVNYESWRGHKLDREMLEILLAG